MARLLFFTHMYPYGSWETFIENEIAYLSGAFDEIVILPWTGKGMPKREVPPNCNVLPPMLKNDRDTLIKGIFCLAPIGYFIRKFFSEKAYTSFGRCRKFITASIFCRALLSNKSFKQVNESFKDDTIYFYWGTGTAFVLPFIKNKRHKVVRFHGGDLYIERRKNHYIPFRKEVYSNLTKAVYISREGLEYARRMYSSIPFQSCVSYLGTPDHGLPSPERTDHRIHLLSCSSVIPVKRIHLILESLKLIRDLPIVWSHIGSGALWQELSAQTKDLPENITVNLPGQFTYPEVIRYYQTHPVDLFINVSSSEGIPVSIMEAISFNIPVLATRVGGTPEIVNENVGILLNSSFTGDDFVRALRSILENKTHYHPRLHWETYFSAEKNYPDFIKKILVCEIKNM